MSVEVQKKKGIEFRIRCYGAAPFLKSIKGNGTMIFQGRIAAIFNALTTVWCGRERLRLGVRGPAF